MVDERCSTLNTTMLCPMALPAYCPRALAKRQEPAKTAHVSKSFHSRGGAHTICAITPSPTTPPAPSLSSQRLGSHLEHHRLAVLGVAPAGEPALLHLADERVRPRLDDAHVDELADELLSLVSSS